MAKPFTVIVISFISSLREATETKLSSNLIFSYIKPSGAFYIFIDLSRVKENYPYEDSFSVKFCEDFLNDERVAIIPGKAFGIDDYVRISYACHEDDFLEGIDRLERYIKKYL